MRIVPNLNDITECPNCGRRGLIRTTNEFGRPFKQCQICTEEIFENEITCSETINRKQELAVQLEDIIHDIPLLAQNQNQLLAYQKICEAFGEIIKYLEE